MAKAIGNPIIRGSRRAPRRTKKHPPRIVEGALSITNATTVAGRLGVTLDGPAADEYPLQQRALADRRKNPKAGGVAKAEQLAPQLQERNRKMAEEFKAERKPLKKSDTANRSDTDIAVKIGRRYNVGRSQALAILMPSRKKTSP